MATVTPLKTKSKKLEKNVRGPLGTTLRNRVPVYSLSAHISDLTIEDREIFTPFIERYKLQGVARRVLYDRSFMNNEEKIRYDYAFKGLTPDLDQVYHDWINEYFFEYGELPSSDDWKPPYHRTCNCHRTPAYNKNDIEVVQNDQKKTAHYLNVQQCGSVYSCPVCAPKITEHRCQEIVMACEKWLSFDNHAVLMLTLTIPHNINQSLQYVLEKFQGSRRRMRRQKALKREPHFQPWVSLSETYGLCGTITSKECTIGNNGWHVHSHELLFLDRTLSPDEIIELQSLITTAWVRACTMEKLDIPSVRAMYQYSVDLVPAKSPADYITKFGLSDYHDHKEILQGGWGAGQEMTKAHIKKSRSNKGMTPFDLLRKILYGEEKEYLKYGPLFYEFSKTFKGHRLIHFSKGFKAQLEIENITDDEIMELQKGENTPLGILTKEEFKLIVKYKKRAEVLILSVKYGWDKVEIILRGLYDEEERKQKKKRREKGIIYENSRSSYCH